MLIPANSNPGGGTLSGTKPVAAVASVATFSDLSIRTSGGGYRLRATATGIALAATPGAGTQLECSGQPTNSAAGATLTLAVQAEARDAEGNTAPAFGGTVPVAIGTNPGGGTLSGTTVVAPVNGVATFS